MGKNNPFEKVWNVIYPLLMYYVIVTIALYVMRWWFGDNNKNYEIYQLIASVIVFSFLLRNFRSDRMLFDAEMMNFSVRTIISCILISLLFSFSCNNIIGMSPLPKLSKAYETASNAFYGSTLAIEIISSVIVTPIVEELVYRGIIFKRLKSMTKMPIAIFLSAFIFAMMHFNIVQFVFAFVLGIVIATIYAKTNHIFICILCHMAINGLAVFRTEVKGMNFLMDGRWYSWMLSIAIFIVAMIGLWLFVKKGNVNE